MWESDKNLCVCDCRVEVLATEPPNFRYLFFPSVINLLAFHSLFPFSFNLQELVQSLSLFHVISYSLSLSLSLSVFLSLTRKRIKSSFVKLLILKGVVKCRKE